MSALLLPADVMAALRQFAAFYREVYAIKRAIAERAWGSLTDSTAEPDVASLARAVFTRLYRKIFALSHVPVTNRRGDAGSVDIGYVMAAVADEVMLHGASWPGQEAWSATLLEESLYGTRVAGDRIFRTADDLASGRSGGERLSAVILIALQLGFRGRYHGTDDRGEIARLKRALGEAVSPAAARGVGAPDLAALLVPDADRQLPDPSVRRLPSLRPWLLATLAFVLVYLVASDAIWNAAVFRIRSTAREIVSVQAAALP